MKDFIVPDRSHLVAEYLLNGNTKDTSRNGYDGTPLNVTYSKTDRGYQTYAGNFNGSSSVVYASHSEALNLAGTSASWLAEFTISTTGTFKTIVHKESGNPAYGGWVFFIDSTNVLGMRIRDSSNGEDNVLSSTTLTTGKSYFAAATYDGANIRIYLNGELIKTQAATRTIGATAIAMGIGGTAAGGAYMNGRIQSVRIFNSVLSETEIRNWYLESLRALGGSTFGELTDGLRIYYDFKGDGNEILNGADATDVGATYLDDGFGGKKGAYLSPDSYYVLPDHPTLLRSQDFTVIMNVKFPSSASEANTAWSDGYGNIYLYNNGGIVFTTYPTGAGYGVGYATKHVPGDVVQVAASISSTGGCKLYCDGVLIASDPYATGNIAVNPGQQRIGTRVWGAPSQFALRSEIYDFWMFEGALTADKISQWNALFRHPTSFLPFE